MIVLDTHIWFWWASGQHERLSPSTLEALATAPRVGVSVVSCFEVASVDAQVRAYPELADRLLA
ncbi:MAG: hypothetical protein KGI90_13780 [Burkholderiales bacterium]|nr:hypothetical protein [Burkholderiales bacterium]MDE2276158.1 hypothetical protein [Burkholderiales bacterium]